MVLVSEEQYNELYSSPHWLKMYFDIKLAENNIKIKPVVYNKHLKHIIALSTLNLGADSPGGGVTSKNAGHAHEYDSNAEWTDYAIHPENPNVKHRHKINNGVIQPAQSECFPDCVEGVAMHAHEINNDIFFAIRYINEVVRKQMKGLKQSYDKKGKEKEGLIGQMLNGASQSGMIGDY